MRKYAAMHRLTFMSGLSEAEQQEVHSQGRLRSPYSPGECILDQSDRSGEAAVIVQGRCRVIVHNADGSSTYLALRGPDDIVGEMAALAGEERSATVIALSEVKIRVLSRQAFTTLLNDHPSIARHLLMMLAHRLREADQARADLVGAATAQQRLSRFLLRLAETEGERSGPDIELDRVSQLELADWCGMSPASVKRGIHTLRKQQIVFPRTRNRIVVSDVHSLRRQAYPS